MIVIVAWLLFTALLLIAAQHFLWATGSTWPVATREQLVRSFIGVESAQAMPSAGLTVLVALLILAAAVLPLWATTVLSLPLPQWCIAASMWVLFGVFSLRGISTYALPKLPRAEPFRSLDRRYFAPLCLVLAAGYLAIALSL